MATKKATTKAPKPKEIVFVLPDSDEKALLQQVLERANGLERAGV